MLFKKSRQRLRKQWKNGRANVLKKIGRFVKSFQTHWQYAHSHLQLRESIKADARQEVEAEIAKAAEEWKSKHAEEDWQVCQIIPDALAALLSMLTLIFSFANPSGWRPRLVGKSRQRMRS